MLEHKFALQENEHHRNTYRQSNLFVAKPITVGVILSLLPAYFLIQYGLFYQYRWLYILFLIIIFLWTFRHILIWWRNSYVLTNQRLLIFEHDGLFKHTVIETPLERVLNVSYKTTGVFSAIWQYGNVEVQVVGLVEPIILKHIPDPEYIKDYLWQMHKRVVGKQIAYNAENIDHYQEEIGYTKKNQKLL